MGESKLNVGTDYPITMEKPEQLDPVDMGLLFPAILEAIAPLGGAIANGYTMKWEYNQPVVTLELRFNPAQLRKYIAQYLRPALCKGQESV